MRNIQNITDHESRETSVSEVVQVFAEAITRIVLKNSCSTEFIQKKAKAENPVVELAFSKISFC